MKLTDEPIYDPRDPKKRDQEMYGKIVAEGRAARRAGLRIDKCPPYREEDWAISWRMGWRWEDEEIIARRVRKL